MAYSNLPLSGVGGVDSLNALARASASFAIALDSTVADAYVAQSNVKANELAIAESITLLERAVRLDSTFVDAHVALGLNLIILGRVPAGLASLHRAYALDSLSSQANGTLGLGWLIAGRPDSSVSRTRAGLEIDQTNVLMQQLLALSLAFLGQRDSSARAFGRAYDLSGERYDGSANLVYAHVLAGRRAAAVEARAALERAGGTNSPFYRRAIADIALGDRSAAMSELERSVDEKEPALGLTSLACDPRFDPLKTNPRFIALVRRLGATICAPTMPWPFMSTSGGSM